MNIRQATKDDALKYGVHVTRGFGVFVLTAMERYNTQKAVTMATEATLKQKATDFAHKYNGGTFWDHTGLFAGRSVIAHYAKKGDV